jgi:hypothetical protein
VSSLTNNLTHLKTLYHYGDKLYEILREIPVHNFYRKDGTMLSEYFNAWKGHLGADHVLKTQTHFVFCRNVEDAEIISEEKC